MEVEQVLSTVRSSKHVSLLVQNSEKEKTEENSKGDVTRQGTVELPVCRDEKR